MRHADPAVVCACTLYCLLTDWSESPSSVAVFAAPLTSSGTDATMPKSVATVKYAWSFWRSRGHKHAQRRSWVQAAGATRLAGRCAAQRQDLARIRQVRGGKMCPVQARAPAAPMATLPYSSEPSALDNRGARARRLATLISPSFLFWIGYGRSAECARCEQDMAAPRALMAALAFLRLVPVLPV